jgi:hypothetical protein
MNKSPRLGVILCRVISFPLNLVFDTSIQRVLAQRLATANGDQSKRRRAAGWDWLHEIH